MNFEKLPRFQGESLGIVCKVPEWADLIFKVGLEEIERQIHLAHGWADANPRKAPKKNMVRYLYNWLLIAQRKGSLLQKPRENYQEIKTVDDEIMTGDDFSKMREAIRR
jgi:hypothetical protein